MFTDDNVEFANLHDLLKDEVKAWLKAHLHLGKENLKGMAVQEFKHRLEEARGWFKTGEPVEATMDVASVQTVKKKPRTKAKRVADKVKPVAVLRSPSHTASVANVGPERRGRSMLLDDEIRHLTEGNDLNEAERKALVDVLRPRAAAFAFNDSEMGKLNSEVVPPARIIIVPCSGWKYPAPKFPAPMMEKAVEFLRQKIAAGVIEPCSGAFAGRWFLIPKEEGKFRFIQDFRDLNAVTVRNAADPPDANLFAERAAGRTVYSTLDLYSGYDQLPLDERDRDLTGMNTPLGHFRMTSLPQGWTNSVGEFQTAVRTVLNQFIPDVTDIFVDDIFVFGPKEDDGSLDEGGLRTHMAKHIRDVAKVLDRLIECGLTVNGKKAKFCRAQVNVLGYLCDRNGRCLNQERRHDVLHFKSPTDRTSLRSFLGLVQAYRTFVKDFAAIAKPLYRLTSEKVEFTWTPVEEEAFVSLKAAVESSPVLVPFRPKDGEELTLSTDASSMAMGAVLEVKRTDGIHPIAFLSKNFIPSQQRYDAAKRELLAIKWALSELRFYLAGQRFTLRTDSKTAKAWILNVDPADNVCLDWVSKIRSYDFKIELIPGEKNVVADCLSRLPSKGEEGEEVGPESCRAWLDQPSGDFGDIITFLKDETSIQGFDEETAQKVRREASKYFITNEVLYRRNPNFGPPHRVVVVNEEARDTLISEVHNGVFGAHRGVDATHDKIKSLFFWPSMYDDVKRVVSQCPQCQSYDLRKEKEPMMATAFPSVWGKVHVDLVEMPRGVRGYKHFIDMRDDLSGFVIAEPLKSKKTAGVVRFLERCFAQFGIPKVLVGDHGEIDCDAVKAKLRKKGIHVAFSSPYHPQSNGVVERGHRELVRALERWLGSRRKGLWPDYLHLATMADNLTVRRRTGFSPFQLMYGREMDLGLQFGIPEGTVGQMSEEELIAARLASLVKHERNIGIAFDRLSSARQRAAAANNLLRRTRPLPLAVGDFVKKSLETASFIPKFGERWAGPYKVKKVLGNGAYILEELSGAEFKLPIHGSRLMRYHVGQLG